MGRLVVRLAALAAGALGLLYIPTFLFVASTEHTHEQVSWASARVIAGEAILPTLMAAGVMALVGGLIGLIAWAANS